VKRKTLAALAALAALSGCGSLAIEDNAPARIEAALQAFSRYTLAMEADRVAAAFTAEGEIQEGDQPPVKAPEAIRATFTARAGARVEESVFKGTSLQVLGPSALQGGTFRQKTRLSDGKVVETKGSFEAEWERQSDGSWLIARLTMNPLPFTPTDAGLVP
jgi:ketosteroid isomerase-like protein